MGDHATPEPGLDRPLDVAEPPHPELATPVIPAHPRLSVGLPVWNGEAFIGEAIAALLGQTFGDLELIISDNASTDGTERIGRDWAARDPRVRYHRNEQNIGLQGNFRRVLELATGTYFMWASHDDVWDPVYAQRMIEQLDANPRLVIAGSNAASIDEHGEIRARFDNRRTFSDRTTVARARRLICASPQGGHATLIQGIVRTETARQMGLATFDGVRLHNRGKYAWDKRALFRLVFEGDFYVDPETLYFHRDIEGDDDERLPQRRLAVQVTRLRRAMAHTRDLHDYFAGLRSIVRGSALARRDRLGLVLLAFGQEVRWIGRYYRSHVRPTSSRPAG